MKKRLKTSHYFDFRRYYNFQVRSFLKVLKLVDLFLVNTCILQLSNCLSCREYIDQKYRSLLKGNHRFSISISTIFNNQNNVVNDVGTNTFFVKVCRPSMKSQHTDKNFGFCFRILVWESTLFSPTEGHHHKVICYQNYDGVCFHLIIPWKAIG